MKRIISMILSIALLLATIPLSVFAVVPPEDAVQLNKKQQLAQMYYEMYGEDGILEEGVNYTWDANLATEEDNSDIDPLWGAGKEAGSYSVHGEIIDAACELGTDIPAKYKPLVKRICQMCDTGFPCGTAGSLHATGNYIATLRYLWLLALVLSEQPENFITYNNIKYACDTVLSYIPNDFPTYNQIKRLNTVTINVLQTYYNTNTDISYDEGGPLDYKKSEQTMTQRCKYIIYGLMSHFLGDLYAHRVLVPPQTVKTIGKNPEKTYNANNSNHVKWYFNPSHFSSYNKTKIEELKTKVTNREVPFNQIDSYCKDPNKTEKEITQALNKAYVDRAAFYPGRVDEAAMTLSCFYSNFSNSYDSDIIIPANSVFSLHLHNTCLTNMREPTI